MIFIILCTLSLLFNKCFFVNRLMKPLVISILRQSFTRVPWSQCYFLLQYLKSWDFSANNRLYCTQETIIRKICSLPKGTLTIPCNVFPNDSHPIQSSLRNSLTSLRNSYIFCNIETGSMDRDRSSSLAAYLCMVSRNSYIHTHLFITPHCYFKNYLRI